MIKDGLLSVVLLILATREFVLLICSELCLSLSANTTPETQM